MQELLLNDYSRFARMRSRKTAKMLANHEAFPAASLTPKLNQWVLSAGRWDSPWTQSLVRLLAPVRGREDTGVSISNWRNPYSRSQLSLQAFQGWIWIWLGSAISDICLLWPLGNVAFLSLGQMLERCLLWVDRGLGGWWGVSQNSTMHFGILSTDVSQMFVGGHVFK